MYVVVCGRVVCYITSVVSWVIRIGDCIQTLLYQGLITYDDSILAQGNFEQSGISIIFPTRPTLVD